MRSMLLYAVLIRLEIEIGLPRGANVLVEADEILALGNEQFRSAQEKLSGGPRDT